MFAADSKLDAAGSLLIAKAHRLIRRDNENPSQKAEKHPDPNGDLLTV